MFIMRICQWLEKPTQDSLNNHNEHLFYDIISSLWFDLKNEFAW